MVGLCVALVLVEASGAALERRLGSTWRQAGKVALCHGAVVVLVYGAALALLTLLTYLARSTG